MTTKLGSELLPGDVITFPGVSYPIVEFKSERPFMGCILARTALVKTGPGPRAFGFVTLVDSEPYSLA